MRTSLRINASLPPRIQALRFPLTLIFTFALATSGPPVVAADEVPRQGSLFAEDSTGALVAMPLRNTDVRAEISGFVAR